MCRMRYDKISDSSVISSDCQSCTCPTSATRHNWVKDDNGNWHCTTGNHG